MVKVIEMKIKNVIIDEIVRDAAGTEQVQFPSGQNHNALLVSLWWIWYSKAATAPYREHIMYLGWKSLHL